MRAEARANAHKGHWSDNDATPTEHVKEAMYHLAKLQIAIEHNNPEAVLEYAADVANHAMFAADVMGALDAGSTPEPAEGSGYEEGVVWANQLPKVKKRIAERFPRDIVGPAQRIAGKH
jgi:hypothetical protein